MYKELSNVENWCVPTRCASCNVGSSTSMMVLKFRRSGNRRIDFIKAYVYELRQLMCLLSWSIEPIKRILEFISEQYFRIFFLCISQPQNVPRITAHHSSKCSQDGLLPLCSQKSEILRNSPSLFFPFEFKAYYFNTLCSLALKLFAGCPLYLFQPE